MVSHGAPACQRETLRAPHPEMRPAIEELLRLGQGFPAILNAID